METENQLLSLPRAGVEEAHSFFRLGVERGSHPFPVSKAELTEGKGQQDRASPEIMHRKKQMAERPQEMEIKS